MPRHHFSHFIVFHQKESYLKENVFSNFQKGCRKSYKTTYEVNGFTFLSDMSVDLLHTKTLFIPVTQELLPKNPQFLL